MPSDPKKTSRRQQGAIGPLRKTVLEQLLDVVLQTPADGARSSPELHDLAVRVRDFDTREVRVVILGGGTGMSTVVGGNSQLPDWTQRPFVGLKAEFRHLDVLACTTDDGGSTGALLKYLPMIGIGDLRKSSVSLIMPENLHATYGVSMHDAAKLARAIQMVFNYRFPLKRVDRRVLMNPLRAVPRGLRETCPPALVAGLRSLSAFLSAAGGGPRIDPAGHSLGNLLLTAAVFRESGNVRRVPSARDLRAGLDHVARLIGGRPGSLHAATSTPGQLRFCYTNGVEVFGQSKAGRVRRGFPVQHVTVAYAGNPVVSSSVCRAIRNADLLIYAPGSLYSSMIPVLQLLPVMRAIRANRRALKVLGANFWIQEGETDISPGDVDRGFFVSDLIEAYDRNVPGGVKGLFDVVLSANLEQVPGSILRNYALEGKRPIHLDRRKVEALGLQPIEAALIAPERLVSSRAIRHDAERFALAIRTLLYARTVRGAVGEPLRRRGRRRGRSAETLCKEAHGGRARMLCEYFSAMRTALESKSFRPAFLRDVMMELLWDNRDIRPEHLAFFRGARVIPAKQWGRSRDWDNVLGYYDPRDRFLKLHAHVTKDPSRLQEEILIALGESLLGNYIGDRAWARTGVGTRTGSRCYQIRLTPAKARRCGLTDAQLRTYLPLARMVPDAADPLVYRITINDQEGFVPSGLLFGLLFAWYLDNANGGVMEYEMSLLRWPPGSLIPHQAKERVRKAALVRFFREEVFGR